jgi:hypothetical protein
MLEPAFYLALSVKKGIIGHFIRILNQYSPYEHLEKKGNRMPS